MNIASLNSMLTMLEIKGIIKRVAGGKFSINGEVNI